MNCQLVSLAVKIPVARGMAARVMANTGEFRCVLLEELAVTSTSAVMDRNQRTALQWPAVAKTVHI